MEESDMTLTEFRNLPDKSQYDILHQESVYIGKRKHGIYTIVLYQVNTFYVEIIYIKYRCKIHRLRCSHSLAFLDPYLSQVNVEDVVNCSL
jgi:hypothetical protein